MRRPGFERANRFAAALFIPVLLFLCLSAPGARGQFVFLEGFGGDADNGTATEGPVVVGQPPSQLSASGLLTEASRLMNAGQFNAAIPYLTEYLSRMKDHPDFRVRLLVQEVRFRLARFSGYQERTQDAIEYLRAYLENPPRRRWREAHRLLAIGLFETGQYEECAAAVKRGIAGPPEGELKRDDQPSAETVSASARDAGLTDRQLRRIERYAEGAEEVFMEAERDIEAEPDYTLEEQVELHLLLAESLAALSLWEETLEPYRFVLANETDMRRKGHAALQLVRALIELKLYEEAVVLVQELFETDARYDLRMNMAMMSTAVTLHQAQRHDDALALYRMVFSRRDYEAAQSSSAGDLYGMVSPPPYDQDLRLRMGQVYADAGRPWEAFLLLDHLFHETAGSSHGARAFYEIIRLLMDYLGEEEQAEARATAYLDNNREGVSPRQIAYLLTAMYYRQERMEEIKSLLRFIDAFAESDDPAAKQYEVELRYMQAVADLMLFNYEQAKAGFSALLENHPGSHQEDNATYWLAASKLFLQRYEEALEAFDAYTQRFPEGNWIDAASFRGGICLFGLERYEEAEARFTHVIETWPESHILSDAHSLRGDLYGAKGLLDEAVEEYRAAIAAARRIEQITYPVFQMVEVFEAEARYEEIIAIVEEYLNTHGEEADIAKAMFWIGKTRLAQGRLDEAVKAYLDTVLRFGHLVRQDGVDLIINELVQVASRRMEDEERSALMEQIGRALQTNRNETLRLRLRALRAKINRREAELGSVLLQETLDLVQVPPPVLGILCQASFDENDFTRAEEILGLFQVRYSDSPFMRSAMKLAAFSRFQSGEADGAMALADEAQALFGVDADMAWAQLLKGRIQFERGELDAARESYLMVLNVRDWRGEPYAEATYYLGRVEEEAGNPRRAFAWYQRAYFQFKGHANGYWAAEAYLASARCLAKLGLENDRRNTFRAMLFDPFVNRLPQADTARAELGAAEVSSIQLMIDTGVRTNITVSVEMEAAQ